ncbi:cadherin-86C isoform X2 [Chrysoperla carnea]|uniref:cadherin-86C isoform X2 n=1 Tax=Chrysoperla carnea TaxID=189513 RepID=UPI001D061889|nr:cadherin-86C isoform X2 [Chrysoperla carnea]
MNIIFFFYSLLIITIVVFAGDPQFDPTTLMELVLVPADTEIGTIIYRLRASDIDFDYPLQFELLDEASKSTIKIDTLACSRYNSVCQANVVLQKRLQSGRYYDFRVRVQDTKGNSNTIKCTITATNNTTPRDVIFPHVPDLIMIPEDAKRGTELGSVIARKNPSYPKPAYIELWGSPVFAIRQRAISDENTEATIFLLGQLDYEKQAMYHLSILANDPYAITKYDTRNIAAVQIVVIVQDVQDQPPIFTEAPPVTQLDNSLVPGDIVVRVHAEDGDKGAPRQIQYGLVSEGNPFTPFFNISEKGEIILARPLDEITAISHPGVPILLTVIAEEIKTGRDEPPAMSSTVQLALILGERGNQPPYFENDNYVSRIEENAPQGTALVFTDPYIPQVSDDDMGKNGVFALTLENNNGTFEISPNVGERRAQFLIKVRDNTLLDYEQRHSVQFRIIAQELGPATNLSTSVDVTVFLIDMNDNPPIFMQEFYQIELPENMTAQTRVTQVYAEDVDTGLYGKVRYTQIIGNQNQSLNLDPITGVITVTTDNHGFDREAQEEYRFYVEARDEDGEGNRATVLLIIKLIDVNDNAPIFERSLYEFILAPDLRNFTNPAIIHAVDADSDYPNNAVRYEIRLGNYEDKFFIIPDTGEILLNAPLTRKSRNQAQRRRQKRQQSSNPDVYVLTARAYDLGVPHLYSDCEVRIYPPESRARTIVFIVAGSNPDRRQTENMLAALTGGRVTIQSIRPYNGREIGGATDVTASGDPNSAKSVVVANVLYNGNSVVDVSHLQNTVPNSSVVRTDDSPVTTVREYRSDSSDLLFWLLILLAFLILALIILLLCCLCQGCPLYKPLKRVIHSTASVAENVHLVHNEKQLVAGGHGAGQENKSVQAVEWGGRATRKEAWSADLVDTRTKATQWQFNRRNNKHHRDTMSLKGYDNGSLKDLRTEDEKSTLKIRGGDEDDTRGPNVIYSREWQQRQTEADDPKRNVMYIEDMENSLGHQRNEVVIDDDSLRRHEYERGSDDEYRNSLRRKLQRQENMVINDTEQAILQNGREQLFIKDGNTEILRLVTRNGRVQEELLQQPQMGRPITIVQPPQTMIQPQYIMVDNEGKNILMQRYIEQQSILNPIHQNMMAMRSNPASVITQNEPYIPPGMANIPGGVGNTIQIPVTSVNSNLESESIPIIPPSNTNMTTTNPSYVSHTRKSTPTNHAQNITSELLETSLRQQNELLRQILLEKERLQQQAGVAAAGSRAGGSHNDDELMKMETQSLPPFQMTTIGVQTQTDCNSSTQTDLELLRPLRRQTRSDNDSFSEDDLNSDNDDEYQVYIIGGDTEEANTTAIRLLKRRKYYKKRKSRLKRDHRGNGGPSGGSMSVIRVVEEIKRKIKTPILEESEHQSPTNHNIATSPIKVAQIDSSSSPKRTIKSGGGIQKEVLREISDSLVDNQSTSDQNVPEEARIRNRSAIEKRAKFSESKASTNYYENVPNDKEFSDDSLNGSETTNKKIFSQGSSTEIKENLKNENKSKTPKIPPKPKRKKENITTHLVDRSDPPKPSSQKPQTSAQEGGAVDVSKSVPRYMQWYKNKKERDKDATKEQQDSSTSSKSKSSSGVSSTKNKVASVRKKVAPKKTAPAEPVIANPVETTIPSDTTRLGVIGSGGGVGDVGIPTGNPGTTIRPLLQHSEHRYEHMYPYPPILYAQPAQIPQHLYVDDAQPGSGQIPPPPIIIQPASSVTTQESTPAKQTSTTNQAQNTTITTTTVITPAPSVARIEDDYDSGIAMTSLQQQQQQQQYPVASYPPGGIVLKKPPITEKKSVFTIKYDDMHTKQLTADSDTPPY